MRCTSFGSFFRERHFIQSHAARKVGMTTSTDATTQYQWTYKRYGARPEGSGEPYPY